MGRLVTLGLIAGAIGASAGTLIGLVLLAFTGLSPEQSGWFIGLCSALTAIAAAIATMVTAGPRETSGGADRRRLLVAVLVGGFAGALLAAWLFGDAPRGKQLIFFAAGSLAVVLLVRFIHYLRRDRSQPLEPAGRSRWFQFTLGSLLAVTLIASVGLSLWVRGPMQRGQALAAVERSGGGRVRFASRTPDWVPQLLGDLARGLLDDVDEIVLFDPTDADVTRLAAIKNLRSLTIGGGRITGKSMKPLSQIVGLEHLSLGDAAIPSGDLVELKQLPRLRSLELGIADDNTLRQIASFSQLESLWLGFLSRRGFWRRRVLCPSTEDLAELDALDYLTELNLDGLPIGNDHLAPIGRLKRLKRLCLNNTDVSDTGLAQLAPLARLEWLELSGTNVTGVGFAELSSLSQLRRLQLNRAPITDQGLEAISKLQALEFLTVDGTGIADSRVLPFNRAGLTRASITPAGVDRLETIWNKRRTDSVSASH